MKPTEWLESEGWKQQGALFIDPITGDALDIVSAIKRQSADAPHIKCKHDGYGVGYPSLACSSCGKAYSYCPNCRTDDNLCADCDIAQDRAQHRMKSDAAIALTQSV